MPSGMLKKSLPHRLKFCTDTPLRFQSEGEEKALNVHLISSNIFVCYSTIVYIIWPSGKVAN